MSEDRELLMITHDRPNPAGYWRTVGKDEVLPPGGHYRLNLDGPAQVWVPAPASRSGSAGE